LDIFVISLEKSLDRRALIQNEMDRLDLHFSFFKAVDGAVINPNFQKQMEKLRYQAYKNISKLRDLIEVVPGEVGCALSHIKIYSHIVKNNIPIALILEDDSEINADLKKIIQDPLLLELAKKNIFEVLNLACVSASRKPVLRFLGRVRISNNQIIGKPAQTIAGTSCYLLTLNGAKKLLDVSIPPRYVADQLLANTEYFGIKLLTIKSAIVYQKLFLTSTILRVAKNSQVEKRRNKSFYKKFLNLPTITFNIAKEILNLIQKFLNSFTFLNLFTLLVAQLGLIKYYDHSFLAIEKISFNIDHSDDIRALIDQL